MPTTYSDAVVGEPAVQVTVLEIAGFHDVFDVGLIIVGNVVYSVPDAVYVPAVTGQPLGIVTIKLTAAPAAGIGPEAS